MPANYPTADPSFTNKSAGQQIQSAHVNALQDEVVAIGSALRSTLQHNVTVNGSITSSNATLSGVVNGTGQPRCFVYSSVAQGFASGAWTALTFETEQYDIGALHSTASNPSRITIPAGSSGLYLCGATVRFSTGGPGALVFTRLIKNSTTEVGAATGSILSSVGSITATLTAPIVLDGGDYVEVEAFPNGSTASIAAATVRRATTEFWAVKVW